MARTRFKVLFGNACQVLNGARRRHSYPKHPVFCERLTQHHKTNTKRRIHYHYHHQHQTRLSSFAIILSLLLFLLLSTTTSMSVYRRLPLQIKKLSDKATIPTQGSEFAAGLDLSSAVDLVIPAGGRALVKTDLSIACPAGTYARIAPRSGLALKKGIDTGAGVIDADYRGPVGVILFNWGSEEFVITTGDRIAQLILEQIVYPDIVEMKEGEELPATERGEGGFGSTGVSNDENDKKKQRTVSPKNDGSKDPEEKHPDPPVDADGMKK
jgi:dUTP pyrophosphatase